MPRPSCRARALLLVAQLFAAAGCRHDAPEASTPSPPSRGAAAARATVTLGRVRVSDETPDQTRPWQPAPARLESALRGAVLTAGVREGAPASSDWLLTARARVVYGVADGSGTLLPAAGAGTAAVRWRVEIAVRVPGEAAPIEFTFERRAERPFDGQGGAPALAALLEPLVESPLADLGATLSSSLDVATRDMDGLIAVLDDASAERRRLAVDRLAARRARPAVPALCAHLKTEADREVRIRMVGALAELGDPRAVGALIAIADPKDREALLAVVDALAELGGSEVTAFFDVLAVHDAPEVRALVAQARARMATPKGSEAPRTVGGANP